MAFALSSVAHELVSNAIRHGSLSALKGRVDVQWSVNRTPHATALVFDWHEHGGPAPRRRLRSGFGSRLINTVIKRHMSGRVRRTFQRGGLRCRLTIPLTDERWPEAAAIG
jgi:two-component sensor histidine kinase